MNVTARIRKLALLVHVGAGVGWFGAVLVFMALAAVGLTHGEPRTVRGVYLVMEPAARLALVPLAFAAFTTGIISSLVTPWGLFRHYWVIFKLIITVVATAVLVQYMATFRYMAEVAASETSALSDVRSSSPLLHAVFASIVLALVMGLAIYKPRGATGIGRHRERSTLPVVRR